MTSSAIKINRGDRGTLHKQWWLCMQQLMFSLTWFIIPLISIPASLHHCFSAWPTLESHWNITNTVEMWFKWACYCHQNQNISAQFGPNSVPCYPWSSLHVWVLKVIFFCRPLVYTLMDTAGRLFKRNLFQTRSNMYSWVNQRLEDGGQPRAKKGF